MKVIPPCSLALISGCIVLLFGAGCKEDKTLFKLLSSSSTGIDFSNTITENDSTNILDYEYVYNGSGVAFGDFNNDGFQDIYFTASMSGNKMYLNKKDFSFRDITAASGTDGQQKWCTGVAVVDINNDGWKDLYVCTSRYNSIERRKNILYINKGLNREGIPVFKDEAEEYGLADTSFSTQAAFFDYDNDGDLDMYLLVSGKMQQGFQPNTYSKKITDGSSVTNDRLYRNEQSSSLSHPYFKDLTKEAGILIEGFGLGVTITDINQDGWKDIYVTNDYLSNDHLWINNHNGTFTDKASAFFKHTSYSAMGNDVQDLNNDGLVDIVALDMLPKDNFRKKTMSPPGNYASYNNNDYFGYDPQYVRNTLQLNQGKPTDTSEPVFSEMALQAGIAETDWSWCPMVADFDNDGLRDIIITNGFPKDLSDRDFLSFRHSASTVASKADIIDAIPVVKIANYVFRNSGDLHFSDVTKTWGMNTAGFSNGAAYADLDNDGDLDCVINNINEKAFVYKNTLVENAADSTHWLQLVFDGNEKNRMGLGAIATVYLDNGIKLAYEHSPYRGYLSSISEIAHFGTGSAGIDSILISWPDSRQQVLKNIKTDQRITVSWKNAGPSGGYSSVQPRLFTDLSKQLADKYIHQETDYVDFNIQKLLPHKLSQYGPCLAAADIDGNGTDDIFAGGAKGHSGKFLIQDRNGNVSVKDLVSGSKAQEDMGAVFFDSDNDGDPDLYIVSGGVESEPGSRDFKDRFYINDGKGNFKEDTVAVPAILISGSAVKAADFDKDGDIDLVRTGRVEPGSYPRPVASVILRNDLQNGIARFTDITASAAAFLSKAGMVTDALWTDFDNDGWPDLLLCREWMAPMFVRNNKGVFSDISSSIGLPDMEGWWNSAVAGDFDNDGDMDYVLGNAGYNTLYKADKNYPLNIYAADFNSDGSFDAIPTVYFSDSAGNRKEYPAFGRDDMMKQMIGIRRNFQKYSDFASATISRILSPEDMKRALHYKASTLGSSYLENLGNMKFRVQELPWQAQLAPVFGMLAWDVDGDGNLDLLVNGNDFGVELSVGKCDALNGLVLKGDGKGHFKALPTGETGFYIPGDGKALICFQGKDKEACIMASQNRKALKVFSPNHKLKAVPVKPDDIAAIIHYRDKRQRKTELYYGHSFLSQSSRNIFLDENAESVELVDTKNNSRMIKF
jgi:hypothetical protein